MRLATKRTKDPDGELMLVALDGARWCSAASVAPSLQKALEDWDRAAPRLRALSDALEDGGPSVPFLPADAACPLPRAYQWLDGSAFLAHGRLMQRAFKLAANPQADTIPLMYQGGSDHFIPPSDPVPFPREEDGIDYEGEFAVVVDAVPMGVSPAAALCHVQLILLANDWSLRALAPREMHSGFGFVHAKPASSFAPLALTPDELGAAWDGRLDLTMHIWRGDDLVGQVPARGMDYDFGQLIAHAAHTRGLSAGTIIGSGTVSVGDPFGVGSSCVAERRGGEMIQYGEARTPYLRFGERVRIAALDRAGRQPFGMLDQIVTRGAP